MQKFTSVESLRGWMAWWVVLGHAIHVSGTQAVFDRYPLKIIMSNGWAVTTFMIISGFVITHLLMQKKEGYGLYAFRRGWRLLPLMFCMIVLAVAVRELYEYAYIANPWALEREMRVARLAEEGANWAPHLLAHITMLHGLIPEEVLPFASSTFLAPAWSISLEWQFYLVAPFLMAALSGRPTVVQLAGIAVLLVLSALAPTGLVGTWAYESFLPRPIVFFFAGMTLRLIFRSIETRGPLPWFAIAATAMGAITYACFGKDPLHYVAFQFAVVGLICGLFFTMAAEEAGLVTISNRAWQGLCWLVARNPLIVAIGTASYSTYLCHIPVFSVIVGAGIALRGGESHGFVIALTVLAVIATLPISLVLYRVIEQPMIRFGSRTTKSWTARQAGPA